MMLQIFADGRTVRARGELDRRLRLAISRIVLDESFDDAFILQDVAHVPDYNRDFEDWCGDISGRYVGALALSSTYTGEDYPQLHRVAQAIPRYQRPTGLIGTDRAEEELLDLKVAWGQGRLLLGLLEYHGVYPSEEILACAYRLGDYYVRTLPIWSEPGIRRNRHYPIYTSALEGLVALYQETLEERYLDAARRMAELVPQDILGADSYAPSEPFSSAMRQSHAYMSSLLGMLALYEVTREESILAFVRNASAQIAQRMLFIDGTPPEFLPWSKRDEGCSTADWLTLNLWLGRITGEVGFFETAERVWRNALYGNQAAHGGFCHHHFGPYGFTGEGNEAWWCCSYHGPRAYYTLLRHLCTWSNDGVHVQFIEPAEVELPTQWGNVRVEQRTRYPSEGFVEIQLNAGPARGVPLSIRVPSWARVREVRRNGMLVDAQIESGYLRLMRPLQPGEIVTLSFPFGVRLGPGRDERRSLWYGPLLLSVEMPGGIAKAVVIPPLDPDGHVALPLLQVLEHPFAVPAAHFKVVGLGKEHREPFKSLVSNWPQVGRLRPLCEQITYAVPPPAVVQLPIIVAETPLLQVELQRMLRGR